MWYYYRSEREPEAISPEKLDVEKYFSMQPRLSPCES